MFFTNCVICRHSLIGCPCRILFLVPLQCRHFFFQFVPCMNFFFLILDFPPPPFHFSNGASLINLMIKSQTNPYILLLKSPAVSLGVLWQHSANLIPLPALNINASPFPPPFLLGPPAPSLLFHPTSCLPTENRSHERSPLCNTLVGQTLKMKAT